MNWYLLGVEMSLGRAHKTRFWYLLGVLSNFRQAPLHFDRGVPPPPGHQICFVYPLTETAI